MKLRMLLCSAMIVSSGVVFAGEDEMTLNLGVGSMMFDDDRNLDNGTVGAIGLEYGFTENVAGELSYLQTSPDLDKGDVHVDVREFRLDGLYYFLTDGRWLPYAAAGVGTGKFAYDAGSFSENQVNLGGGVRFVANEILSFRADLRGIRGDEDSDIDTLFTLGMSWTFGDGNNIGKKTRKQPVVPVSKPVQIQKTESKPVVAAPVVKDSDADGVPDEKDRCANTTAGVAVDANGCELDTDGDGVADSNDKCPNTVQGTKVNSKGCKIKKMTVETIELDIKFPTNSSEVRAQYSSELKKVADFLNKHKDLLVNIEGHSDSRGKASYNKALSQRRADAVKSAIVSQFSIDASRIKAIGFGEEKPVASNDTADGRQKNRRVIAVMQKEVIE